MPEYRKGRFVKGRSGNPAGRPHGARGRKASLVEALLDAKAEAPHRKGDRHGDERRPDAAAALP